VNIMTSGSEKEFRLGAVARTISDMPDLFSLAAESMVVSSRLLRFPTGPAIALRAAVGVSEEERDAERWDGLY
jgi:hypothetical protein